MPPSANASTVQRIVDAAIPLFAHGGIEGVTVDEIATAAGVPRSTLTHHFPAKQQLFDAAVAEVYGRMERGGERAIPKIADQDIDGIVATLYFVARSERDGVRLLERTLLDRGGLGDRARRERFGPVVDRAARLLAMATGVPVARARLIVVSVGSLLGRFGSQSGEDLMAVFDTATELEAHAAVCTIIACLARGLLAPQ
jgi:AcrR family transcriptional regulator